MLSTKFRWSTGKFKTQTYSQIEDVCEAKFYSGPPSVQTIWLNTAIRIFAYSASALQATINEVFVNIAEHVKDNLYSIVSISASAYAMTVLCCTSKSQPEFSGVVHAMQRTLGRLVISPEEQAHWDVAVEKAGR